MKITFIIGAFGGGGKERQLSYLIKEMSSYHQIQLIHFGKEIFYNEVLSLPIEIIKIPKGVKYTFKTLKELFYVLDRFQPKVIHSWSNSATLLLFPFLLVNRKVKLVSSIRYAGVLRKTVKGSIIKFIAHFRSSAIVSNSAKGLFVENLHNHPKGVVIYNGLDIASFHYSEDFATDNICRYSSFSTVVVMIGRFYQSKDYFTYINVAKEICSLSESVCFLCVGDGPDRSAVELKAGGFNGKQIHFLGRINNVASLLRKSTIGVLLNNTNGHAEGISNAIMEYMAAGLPVIATDAGGTPELLKDGVSGFLVPAFDVKAVVDKLFFLIQNPMKAKEMGENGLKIINNEFSINKMISQYVNLYKKIANE